MTVRVYRFGCDPPNVGADIVRAQMRAAHDYRNDLVRIEIGRRAARVLITDDRSLSREARFGDASELRFAASTSELRDTLRMAFGGDAHQHPWREETGEDDDRGWCERAIDAWTAGTTRKERKQNKIKHGEGGAWRSRKAAKQAKAMSRSGAREVGHKHAESDGS